MRCLRHNLAEATDLVSRLLATADFGDHERLLDIFLELRNDMKSALVPPGHQFAMLRAASMISESVAREEQWRGVTQLLYLEKIAENAEKEIPRIAELLGQIRSTLLVRPRLIANATAKGGHSRRSLGRWTAFHNGCPEPSAGMRAGIGADSTAATSSEGLRAESLLSSASVGYVAWALPGFRYEHPLNGPAAVLGHLLSTGYLWEKVRMEGGAYGAYSFPRNTDGLFLFGSYRDPKIAGTLRAFRDALEMTERGALEKTEVEKAVIGTIGREDRPMDPGEKGFVSLQRKLHGVSDAVRQEEETTSCSPTCRRWAGWRAGSARVPRGDSPPSLQIDSLLQMPPRRCRSFPIE